MSRMLVASRVCLSLALGLPLTAAAFEVVQAPTPPASEDRVENAEEIGSDGSSDSEEDLLDLDISQLRQTSVAPSFDEVVTTVSRQESTVGRSPAAVFVITQEMIRRGGARSIPEVLRMAPGIHVARIDGNKWAIAIRGGNSRYSNKLLVQVDGRTVYRNTFSGVWWDEVGVLLADVERIEVVRGPGATVWGANAVNGIINILTKSTRDTRGAYAIAGGGTEEQGFAGARLGGGSADDRVTWRAWGKWFERDEQFSTTLPANDGTQDARGGARIDWTPTDEDLLTFQAGIYNGASGTTNDLGAAGVVMNEALYKGRHVQGSWTHEYSDTNSATLQFYYEHAERDELTNFVHWSTYDVDFQHSFQPRSCHRVVWGVNYRNVSDIIVGPTDVPTFLVYTPQGRDIDLVGGFLQDEIELISDKLFLTLGAKLSYYDLSSVDVQPSARILSVIDDRRVAWGAISRAVRYPGRVEEDAAIQTLISGNLVSIAGNTRLKSEHVISYELGYRAQPSSWFSWDAAGFYSAYENLISIQPTGVATFLYENAAAGSLYGVELAGELTLCNCWRVSGHYSFVDGIDKRTDQLQSGARNIAYLRSSWDLCEGTEFDAIVRYVDAPFEFDTPQDSYVTLDLRVSHRISDQGRFSVVGQNLLDRSHLEWESNTFGQLNTEVQRAVYGMYEATY